MQVMSEQEAVVDHFSEIGSFNMPEIAKFAQEKGTNLNDHEEEEDEIRIIGNPAKIPK